MRLHFCCFLGFVARLWMFKWMPRPIWFSVCDAVTSISVLFVNFCCVPLIFNKSWRSPLFSYFSFLCYYLISVYMKIVTPYCPQTWLNICESQVSTTFNFKWWGTIQLFANMRINIAIRKDTLIWFHHPTHFLFWGDIYHSKTKTVLLQHWIFT